mgnify:CR=1 FL=1
MSLGLACPVCKAGGQRWTTRSTRTTPGITTNRWTIMDHPVQ